MIYSVVTFASEEGPVFMLSRVESYCASIICKDIIIPVLQKPCFLPGLYETTL